MVEPESAKGSLLKRGGQFFLENVIATIIGAVTLFVVGLVFAYFWAGPGHIVFDFQAEQRCPNGKLTTIRKRFENPNLPLTNGADQLTICDTEALDTVRSEAPRDLASKYKGCLKWDGRELTMLRASDAVCALPDDSGYICDGANSRTFPGSSSLGIGQAVPPCPAELLRGFGFAS